MIKGELFHFSGLIHWLIVFTFSGLIQWHNHVLKHSGAISQLYHSWYMDGISPHSPSVTATAPNINCVLIEKVQIQIQRGASPHQCSF